MRRFKRFLAWSGGVLLLLAALYLAGPRPATPQFAGVLPPVPADAATLENEIRQAEAAERHLKPDNQARIVWADSTRKRKTRCSFLYLHGFGASQAEGAPVHANLARRYGANLYLARLYGHGLGGDSVFAGFTAGKYVASAQRALAVARALGDSVVVVGTSAGGGLALYLAAHHPGIRALVLYSPAIRLHDGKAALLDGPWGRQILRGLVGSDYLEFPRKPGPEEQYWSNRYWIDGLVGLQTLMENALNPDTFARVTCPVYLAYYYKNENEQDKVVSVPRMLDMYGQLGTPAALKREQAFPNTGHHVIASYIRSADWAGVQAGTERFLDEVVRLAPKTTPDPVP